MALARLSLLKSAAFLNETTTDHDTLLKMVLEVATSEVAKYCNRMQPDGITNAMESATYTDELYDGGDAVPDESGYRRRLYLNHYPVTAVAAVKIWDGDDSYDTETASYYSLTRSRFIQYPAIGQDGGSTYASWPAGANRIKVTYTAGYVTTNWDTLTLAQAFAVPRNLEYAVAKLASLMLLEGKGDGPGDGRIGLSGIAKGVENISIVERGITRDIALTLGEYRKFTV